MKNETLYINQNGMTFCWQHGGSYLRSYVEAHPTAHQFDTPLDNWLRVLPEEKKAFAAEGSPLRCEGC